MKKLFYLILVIVIFITSLVPVNAASITSSCGRTWCSNRGVTVTLGSGSRSISGNSVTASTSTTHTDAVTAYAKAGITMVNGETYSRWDEAVTSASVTATLPSSAPSPFSYGWSSHRSEAKCYYCQNTLSGSISDV